LMTAMQADWPGAAGTKSVLRVDGGMTASDWTMQRLADILDAPVDRPRITETTALGAAYLAGLSIGLCPKPPVFMTQWQPEHRFEPKLDVASRQRLVDGWQDSVRRTLSMRA